MQIPGYQIEKELGHGGMATVYLALQESLHRKVALKIMSPALAADRNFSERFIREARTIAELNHPNIVSVHDVGIHDHAHYIAMEYIAGGDLKQSVQSGTLSPEQALIVTREIAKALGYAHSKGYVHRDIKPENILFRENGTVALTDFGIAKSISAATKMTGTGMSIGTPHYMSPEQARGQTVDNRADLYSLGIVLYEMLTGQQPFDADDTMAIGIMHITEAVPRLPEHLNRYQPLIDNLLAKEPDQRINNAEKLCQEIDNFLEQGSFTVTAKKTSAVKSSNQMRWALGGALAASCLLAAGFYANREPTVVLPSGSTSSGTVTPGPVPGRVDKGSGSVVDVFEPEKTEEEKRAERLAILAEKQEIEHLLKGASEDIIALRLTNPVGNNALDKLQQVLALDSDNGDAEAGLARLVNKYLQLAEGAANKRNFDKAEGYLETAEAILPGFAPVRQLKDKLRVWPGRVFRDKLKDGSLGPSMVVIPAGSFLMGSPAGEKDRQDDEGPQHKVTISKPFAMGKYEVTVAQFRAFVTDTSYKTDAENSVGGDKGCYVLKDQLENWKWGYVDGHNWRDPNYKTSDTRPVTCVSWNDAQAYITWLNKQTGKTYRLPTEAEWEYAARAGTSGARFWGSQNKACEYANVADNTERPGISRVFSGGFDCDDKYFYPAPVGTYKSNPFGLKDIFGNVWEWTEDCWHSSYQGAPANGSSWTAGGDCSRRVVRGGAWNRKPQWVRAANRNWYRSAGRSIDQGFRVVQAF